MWWLLIYIGRIYAFPLKKIPKHLLFLSILQDFQYVGIQIYLHKLHDPVIY